MFGIDELMIDFEYFLYQEFAKGEGCSVAKTPKNSRYFTA